MSFLISSVLLDLVMVGFCVVSKEPPKMLQYTVLYEIIKDYKTIPIRSFKNYLFSL